jgi:hypothetical protein
MISASGWLFKKKTQPCVAFPMLEFHSPFFLCVGKYAASNSLTVHRPVSVVSCVTFLDGSWMGLVFLVL